VLLQVAEAAAAPPEAGAIAVGVANTRRQCRSRAPREHAGPFDDVPQLPDIPGHECASRRRRLSCDTSCSCFRSFPGSARGKTAAAEMSPDAPQWGEPERNDVQAIDRSAGSDRPDGRVEVPVCGDDQAHVYADRVASAHPLQFLLLHDAQAT